MSSSRPRFFNHLPGRSLLTGHNYARLCTTDSRKTHAREPMAMLSSCAATPTAYIVMRHKALTGIAR